jgi:hypothetical protein
MVGNETDYRDICDINPLLRCPPECRSFGKEGVSLFECRNWALENQPRADDADAKDKAATQASTQAGLYDALRSRPLPPGSAAYTPPSQIFPDWVVHGEPSLGDYRPEVDDDKS